MLMPGWITNENCFAIDFFLPFSFSLFDSESLTPTPLTYFAAILRLSSLKFKGILRYKVDFQSLQLDEPLDDVDLDDY